MMSVLVVLYYKGIYISMEYMQKLLFFAKCARVAPGALGARDAGVYDEWSFGEKNSGNG